MHERRRRQNLAFAALWNLHHHRYVPCTPHNIPSQLFLTQSERSMKIGPFASTEPLPLLPTEIIEHIIAYLDLLQDVTFRQRTIWACCLLSRSWYTGAIKTLYRSPVLTGRNFDLFTRTICPPVHSNARAIGLEALVVDLDMGSLAYESTKSLTARMLRRTHKSLETFVAPAVSFSLAGLAPLSKSPHLRCLDLSNDSYHINVNELLRSISDIENLWYLSLPRNALHTTYLSISRFSFRWPPGITHLQINGALPDDRDGWEGLIDSLPESLVAISFQHLRDLKPFWNLQDSSSRAESIRRLSIGEPARDSQLELRGLLDVFPNIKRADIPLSGWDPAEWGSRGIDSKLERIWLQEGMLRRIITPRYLMQFAEPLKSLRRIQMSPKSLAIKNYLETRDFEYLKDLLTSRKPLGTKLEAGLFSDAGSLIKANETDDFWANVEGGSD